MLDDGLAQPRIAFVLGSGGVRSIAALGIAEVLAGEGIRPDLIVGCSSGALIGATLALGLSSHEALHTATSLWSAELTQQHRWRAYPQLLAPRWFGFDAGFALRDDQRIEQRIRERLRHLAARGPAHAPAGGRHGGQERSNGWCCATAR